MWWLRPPLLPPLVGGRRQRGAKGILRFGEGWLRMISGTQSPRAREAGIPLCGAGLLVHSCEQGAGIHPQTRSGVRCSSPTVNPFTHRSSAARGCHVPARRSSLASQAPEERGGAAKNRQ